MRLIQCVSEAEEIPEGAREYVKGYLEEWLKECETADGTSKSLDGFGKLVFLQSPEDCEALEKIGFSRRFCELQPEYVECIRLRELALYCACVLTNNEHPAVFFSVKGSLGEENEQFLKTECETEVF